MKKIILFCACIFSFVLVGCRLELVVPINFTDIFSAENKLALSTLKLEVWDCKDNTINDVLKKFYQKDIDIRYHNRCEVDENLRHYAYFSMPMDILKVDEPLNSDIYFAYIDNLFIIGASDRLTSLLQGTKSDWNNEIKIKSIEIELLNDTKNDITIQPLSLFVNNTPFYVDELTTIRPFDKVYLKLSDFMNSYLMETNRSVALFLVEETSDENKE